MLNDVFKKVRPRVAAVSAATLLATATLGVLASAPATALEGTVSIRAELDLPDIGTGPLVYEVNDVVVGDGPELVGVSDGDAANSVSNPSSWCGDLTVDIDPVAQTITVMAGADPCDFQTLVVTVTSDEFTEVSLVSDALFNLDGQCVDEVETCTPDSGLTFGLAEGVATFSWNVSEGGYIRGAAVFSYTVAPEEEEEQEEVEQPVEVVKPVEQPVVAPVLPITGTPAVALPTPPRVSE